MADPRNLVLQLLITAKDQASSVFSNLKGVLAGLGVAIAGAFSVKEAAAFERQLDAVATKGGYTVDEMRRVSEEVSQVARNFNVTGTEAGQALEVLAAAGLRSAEALQALPAVLALASNEGIGFEEAANLISNSVAIMGLSFEEAGRVSDVLTQGANISKTSAVALGAALVETGASATAAGLSLEETTAILAALAKNGIEGEKAGTALKNVFAQLGDPASKARQELTGLGITTGDASEALNQLATVPLPLAEKAITAFGLEAGPALRAYLKEGQAGIDGYIQQLQAIEGTAYDVNKSLSDNLLGAIDGLSSSWNEVLRVFATPLLGPLKTQADALSATLRSFIDSGVLTSIATGLRDAFVSGLEAVTNFVKAIDFTPVAVAFERVKASASEAASALGSLLPSAASAGAVASKALATVMENLTALIGAGLAAATAKAVQGLAALATQTYTWVAAQVAARQAAADQAILLAAQRRETIALAQANVAAATATLNKAVAERAHAAAVLAAMQANLGYGVSEAEVAAARVANVAAGNAATAAAARLAAANEALTAANATAAASTTLLSRAMTFLAGPGGLILAAVGAFALLFTRTSEQIPVTDALAKSTDDYAKALKEQTEWQIRAAQVDLQKQIQQQQELIAAAERQAELARLRLIDDQQQQLNAAALALAQDQVTLSLAALEAEQQKLKDLEERRALILQELGDRQSGVSEAMKTAQDRMAPYAAALDAANKAHEQAVQSLAALEPGMRGFGEAVDAVNTANDAVQLSQARYNVELQNLIRGLPEAADQTRNLAIQQAASAKSASAQAEAARTAADSADQLAAAAEKTVQAQLEALQAERDLAVARGDTAEAGRLSVQIYKLERTSALANAEALQASAGAARSALEAKQKAAKASGDFTTKTRDEITALQQEVAQKDASARAALARANTLTNETREEERLLTALREAAQTSYDLAKAKGNEYEARRQLTLVAQTEARLAQLNAQKKLIELQSANAIVAALQREIQERQAAGEAIDEATAKRLRSATIAQETAAIEAAAAGRVAEAERQKAAATALGKIGKDQQNDATKKNTEVTGENTEATGENTQATENNAKATDGAAKKGGDLTKIVGGLINYWRQQTAALSEATLALFELKAGLSKGIDISLFPKLSDEAATKEIEKANAMIKKMDDQMAFSTGSVGYFMDKVQKAGSQATKAYYEQKLAAEALEASINQVGVSAVTRFGVTETAAKTLTDRVEQSIRSFNLLNDQDLDQLRAAMDSANAKLRQMQEETQSARDRLAELNAELLEAQGQDQKAELLRQQLEYQQALAEIERQREEATLTGNRELLSILAQQQATLEKINRAKIANIEADAKNRTSTDVATQRVSRLADETERASRAMKDLGSSSLATLSDQAGSLRQHLSEVNSLL